MRTLGKVKLTFMAAAQVLGADALNSVRTRDEAMRFLRCLALLMCLSPLPAFAQTASVGGMVQDSSQSVIPNASVEFRNQDTGIRMHTTTNSAGIYHIDGLAAGKYEATVQVGGFKTLTRSNVVFQVDEEAKIDFTMRAGAATETVTVNGNGAVEVNTTDATVSTVVDREFIKNMPLNGRSIQDLILLSPGVTTQDPQGTDSGGSFSVNGQRTESNNFTVDGVSANNQPASMVSSPGSAGMMMSTTALGTTQSMLSVDAMQEFRITTSTYSAEFGRSPGAQIMMQSRSGTKEYHGTLFDYLRNSALDANDWFNDYSTPALPKPAERQNDFGGTVGGPLAIPRLIPRNDGDFFFFNYEGLRLTLPSASTIVYVPSNGTYNQGTYSDPRFMNLRANAPAILQPVLNAFPLPNCTTAKNLQCVDYRDGLSPYIFSMSTPSLLNSINGRLDFNPTSWIHAFARYADTGSWGQQPYGVMTLTQDNRNRVFLAGIDSDFGASTSNELRAQWSPVQYISPTSAPLFGGGTPVSLWALNGLAQGGEVAVQLNYLNGATTAFNDLQWGSRQYQTNATDTFNKQWRTHLFRAGVDYRQTTAYLAWKYLAEDPVVLYIYQTSTQLLNNSTYETTIARALRQDPTTKNLGVFFQDEWRVRPRFSLSLGLRWDLNPPPSVSGAQNYTYAGDLSNPATLSLAPLGTSLYKTTFTNFAPRFGTAITLRNRPGHETILRGGGGLFFDTGQNLRKVWGGGLNAGSGFTRIYTGQSYRVASNVILEPVPAAATPYALGYAPDRNLIPPSTIQWNVSLEQSLSQGQSLTASYVGSEGRNLLTFTEEAVSGLNPSFQNFYRYWNGPGSNYNSLQVEYNWQMRKGLQVLAAHTWAHAIDSDSTNYGLEPIQRGNGDHDVRNNFTAAVVYDLPTGYTDQWKRQIAGNWGIDLRFTVRSAFPVAPVGPNVTDPVTGELVPSLLDYNGQNPYVRKGGIPGGRQFNPAVFSVPTTAQGTVGNAPRNFLRGFDMAQANTAIRRNFSINEHLHLLFRAEAFNVTNHPNFGFLNVTCGVSTPGAACNNVLMGQATKTLANSLTQVSLNGGQSGIYAQGGPRSLQVALTFEF